MTVAFEFEEKKEEEENPGKVKVWGFVCLFVLHSHIRDRVQNTDAELNYFSVLNNEKILGRIS